MRPGTGTILRDKSIILKRLDRSPFLQHRLRWKPCSPLDGLSRTLLHGTTTFRLHELTKLIPPPSDNLAVQLAAIDAGAVVPSCPGPHLTAPGGRPAPPPSVTLADQLAAIDAAAVVPSCPGPHLTAPGGTPRAVTGHNLDTTPCQLPGQEMTACKPPERDVLWCSWEGEHGHLDFPQPLLATPHQVRPLLDRDPIRDVFLQSCTSQHAHVHIGHTIKLLPSMVQCLDELQRDFVSHQPSWHS